MKFEKPFIVLILVVSICMMIIGVIGQHSDTKALNAMIIVMGACGIWMTCGLYECINDSNRRIDKMYDYIRSVNQNRPSKILINIEVDRFLILNELFPNAASSHSWIASQLSRKDRHSLCINEFIHQNISDKFLVIDGGARRLDVIYNISQKDIWTGGLICHRLIDKDSSNPVDIDFKQSFPEEALDHYFTIERKWKDISIDLGHRSGGSVDFPLVDIVKDLCIIENESYGVMQEIISLSENVERKLLSNGFRYCTKGERESFEYSFGHNLNNNSEINYRPLEVGTCNFGIKFNKNSIVDVHVWASKFIRIELSVRFGENLIEI